MQFPFKYNKMGRTTNGHYMINGGYMNLWPPIHVHTHAHTKTQWSSLSRNLKAKSTYNILKWSQ